MSANYPESPGRGGIERETESGVYARLKRTVSTVAGHRRAGSVALLAAGVLLGYGLWRRWASDGPSTGGPVGPSSGDADAKVSDEAHAARERHDVSREPETNPRGTAADRDATTRPDPDAGEIAFSEDQAAEPRSKPRLDETAEDPRYEADPEVQIDLSEASMTDEASEATGPDPEQAQPTQTEATEPESSPPEDVGDVESDEAAERARDEEPDATGPSPGSDASASDTPEDPDGTRESDEGDAS